MTSQNKASLSKKEELIEMFMLPGRKMEFDVLPNGRKANPEVERVHDSKKLHKPFG